MPSAPALERAPRSNPDSTCARVINSTGRPAALENPLHRGPIIFAAQQPLAEALLEAFLDAQVVRRETQRIGGAALEHLGDAALIVADRVVADREAHQDVAVFVLEIDVDPIDIVAAGAAVAGQVIDLVNLVGIIAINQHEIAPRVCGENIDPEIDLRFERSEDERRLPFRRAPSGGST